MLFGGIDWDQVLQQALIGGIIGGVVGGLVGLTRLFMKKKPKESDEPGKE